MTLEESEKAKEKQLKLLQLQQNQEALNQSKNNTKITIFVAVAGLLLTFWQIKKGKK